MPVDQTPLRGVLQTRQARPLNGKEVAEAIETHLLTVTEKMLSKQGLLSDQVIILTEELKQEIQDELSKQPLLQKVNLTFPGVSWNIKTRLEQLDNESYLVNAEVELDLMRNARYNIQFGQSGVGKVISSEEDEKIQTNVPDKDRQAFGLQVTAEYLRPDGTTGKVNISQMQGEKRAARTVDVGKAKTIESEVSTGAPVVLPSELPEVVLDDVVAAPPELEKAPLFEPLPSADSMAAKRRPDVKFKRLK